NDYHVEPLYIEGLAANIKAHRTAHPGGEHLLMSFHGIPARYTDEGDPYRRKCEATAAALAQRLDLQPDDWSLSFQSRVGLDRWLAPYTGDALMAIAARGIRRIDVVCPGFAVDCLETTDEIGHEYAELFQAQGGGKLHYIPALNAGEEQLALLTELVTRRAWQFS
ncbi:MAG: ferrochelatase, partial [Pseudomonadota bacterium]